MTHKSKSHVSHRSLILAGLAAALIAAPAFAQTMTPPTASPPQAAPPASANTPADRSAPSQMSKPQAQAKPHPKPAKTAQRSCYDLAWQSQTMKDCLARHPEQTGQLPAGGTSNAAVPGEQPRNLDQEVH